MNQKIQRILFASIISILISNTVYGQCSFHSGQDLVTLQTYEMVVCPENGSNNVAVVFSCGQTNPNNPNNQAFWISDNLVTGLRGDTSIVTYRGEGQETARTSRMVVGEHGDLFATIGATATLFFRLFVDAEANDGVVYLRYDRYHLEPQTIEIPAEGIAGAMLNLSCNPEITMNHAPGEIVADAQEGSSESAPNSTRDSTPTTVNPICSNTCRFANDGECDDGGPNSIYSICQYGTDCSDCGARAL